MYEGIRLEFVALQEEGALLGSRRGPNLDLEDVREVWISVEFLGMILS